jgi:hypothetical protein
MYAYMYIRILHTFVCLMLSHTYIIKGLGFSLGFRQCTEQRVRLASLLSHTSRIKGLGLSLGFRQCTEQRVRLASLLSHTSRAQWAWRSSGSKCPGRSARSGSTPPRPHFVSTTY